MKKNIRTLLVTAVVLVAALTVSVGMAAAKYGSPVDPNPVDPTADFVDADGDGLCDNYTGEMQGRGDGAGLAPQDGSGYGSAAASQNMHEASGEAQMGQYGATGGGNMMQSHNQAGSGSSFIDADGDGVCDLLGE